MNPLVLAAVLMSGTVTYEGYSSYVAGTFWAKGGLQPIQDVTGQATVLLTYDDVQGVIPNGPDKWILPTLDIEIDLNMSNGKKSHLDLMGGNGGVPPGILSTAQLLNTPGASSVIYFAWHDPFQAADIQLSSKDPNAWQSLPASLDPPEGMFTLDTGGPHAIVDVWSIQGQFVPEPKTWWLWLVACACVALVHRRANYHD